MGPETDRTGFVVPKAGSLIFCWNDSSLFDMPRKRDRRERTAFLSNRSADYIPAAEWSMAAGGESYVPILPAHLNNLLIDLDFLILIILSSTVPRRSCLAL